MTPTSSAIGHLNCCLLADLERALQARPFLPALPYRNP